MNAPLLLALTALLVPLAPQDDAPQDPLPEADPEITAAELSHHVHLIAGDAFRGRMAGSEDAHRAARYLARCLERAGFEPAGDDGTFLQRVPLRRIVWEKPHELQVTWGKTYLARPGVDFTVRVRGLAKDTGELEVVHLESGDDVPAEANPKQALLFHTTSSQMRRALRGTDHGGEGFGLLMRVGGTEDGRPEGKPADGRLQRATADLEAEDRVEQVTLRGLAGRDAPQIKTVQLTFHGGPQEIVDYNVVAKLPGVGTAKQRDLKDEVVVLSAHYDHVGVGDKRTDDADEDVIYNGADDDASGVATVLEMAEALGAAKQKPARTVHVLLAAAEEHGMLGTYHYADHPPFPLEAMNCNLNFEMVGRPDELVGGAGQLWLSGFDRSTLGPRLKELGIGVAEDMRPEQSFFTRSDNIVFVKKGIVGQTFSSYNMHRDYHQPSDDPASLDYAHMEQAVRACFDAVRLVVDGEITPQWNEGEPKLGRR